jgi:hypothetical protein
VGPRLLPSIGPIAERSAGWLLSSPSLTLTWLWAQVCADGWDWLVRGLRWCAVGPCLLGRRHRRCHHESKPECHAGFVDRAVVAEDAALTAVDRLYQRKDLTEGKKFGGEWVGTDCLVGLFFFGTTCGNLALLDIWSRGGGRPLKGKNKEKKWKSRCSDTPEELSSWYCVSL